MVELEGDRSECELVGHWDGCGYPEGLGIKDDGITDQRDVG